MTLECDCPGFHCVESLERDGKDLLRKSDGRMEEQPDRIIECRILASKINAAVLYTAGIEQWVTGRKSD